MAKSSTQTIDHPNGVIAQIEGVIDGTFDLRPLIGEHEIVLFDLSGVKRITSFGVREWRNTLNQVRAHYLCFVGCRASVVAQFNLVPGFACGGELVTFYLPYICPSCDRVHEELLDLRHQMDIVESLAPPVVTCASCGAEMEFDDIPAAYFKYVRSVRQPRPPAAASAMIDDRSPASPQREFSVKKTVEDTVTAFWLSGTLDNRRALRRMTEGIEGDVVVLLEKVDDITSDGMAGFVEFLRAIETPYLCRVPERMITVLTDRIKAEGLDVKLVSVQTEITCPQCGSAVVLGLDKARLAAFVEDSPTPFRHCPSCAQGLDGSALPQRVLDVLDRVPLAEPPEAVQLYLQHRATGRGGETPSTGEAYVAPGGLLFGNYRIIRRLGEGGMGEVLLARYVGPDKFEKLVVLKRVRRDHLKSARALQEFQREARISARLSHPNIVQIFDFNRFDDEYFLAMEYVNGIDLRRVMGLCSDHDMTWPLPLCLRVVSDVCAGLEAAHDYRDESGLPVPIYHRDVSPENIIISVNGIVKLMDFGIAKAADSSVSTDAGVFKGKHAYSAPEQFDGDVPGDHRTDIYAAGIVLFELLAMRRFVPEGSSLPAIYEAAIRPPPNLVDVRDDIPEGLQEIFATAVARERGDRFQSAFQFREALETLMKKGEYPTHHDLASWIRRVMTLEPATTAGARSPDDVGATDRTDPAVDSVPTRPGHLPTQAPKVSNDHGKR